MSYSIHLEAAACPTCGQKPPEPYCPDPTYNLARIFHLALTGDAVADSNAGTFDDVVLAHNRTREPFGLELLNGKTGAESVPTLSAALERVTDQSLRPAFTALAPANGWGDLSGAIKVLISLTAMAEEYPSHRWRVY
jgi:hypothetical protein